MRENFERSFELVIGHEGGFTKRRRDPGNWTGGRVGVGELKGTKYGISAASYPDLRIEALTLEEAKNIYYQDYWRETHCDDHPSGVDYACFDAAVNAGPGRAIRFLQSAVGTLADGIWGPASRAALRRKLNDVPAIIRDQNAHRMWHWMRLDHMDDEYGLGWSRRGIDVDRTAMEFYRGEKKPDVVTGDNGEDLLDWIKLQLQDILSKT